MALHYTTGTELVPGFRLVKLLGRGGFGEVWKASAPGGTDAAIKIISLGERTGFKELRAIRLVKAVRHPNLVPITAYWLLTADGEVLNEGAGDNTIVRRAQELYLVIAMGLGDKSLHDRLKECQRGGMPGIPAAELVNHLEDAARAVDYLNQPVHDLGDHTGGIQHCDLKPQNLLLVGGAAQVCDFGLARVLGDSRVTSAKGSAAYMAPELIADNKPSKNTDQYFLAISYVELRTGSLPVDTTSPAKAIWAHVQGQLDLSKLPAEEAAVIKRATAVKPEDRYASCLEMARALRQAIEGGPAPSQKRPSRILKPEQFMTPGSEVVPGYKLIRLLGKGGYGHVWEASAPGGKKVALKIIRNLEGVQGKQEFKALELIKGVDHNHLMELHAFWLLDRNGNVIPDEDRDQPDAPAPSILVIASKLANMNLLQRLNECRGDGINGIPLPELMSYMRQAAEAIDYLNTPQHQLGDRKVSIQHRDIKPENILLASNVVKVGDFGLAKVVEGTSAVIHGDSAGLTLAYAAPEMFTSVVTAWSDQYCLGLTYFKLRTGGWPFPPEAKPNEIIKSHVLGKLDLSLLPEAERPVLARATAVKPENRFPTCLAMIEEMERVLRGADELPPASLRQSVPKSQRKDGLSGIAATSGSSLSSSSPKALAEPPPAPSRRSNGPLTPEAPSQFEETLSVPVDAGPSDTAPPSITPSVSRRSIPAPPMPPVVEMPPTGTFNPMPAPPAPEAKQPAPEKPEQIQSRAAPPRPPTVDLDQSLRAPLQARTNEVTRGRADTPLDTPKRSAAPAERPTHEPVRLPTQDVEMPVEASQRRPAARSTWKEGKPPSDEPATPAPSGRGVGKVLVFVVVVALVGAAGYFGRGLIPFLFHDSTPEDVRQLIRERRFSEAMNRLDTSRSPDELKKELRDATRTAWLEQARRLYHEDRDFRRAAAEAGELLVRFPDDVEMQKLHDQAKPAAQVAEGIENGGDYAALQRTLTDARGMDEPTRKELEAKLLKAWTRDTRNELFTRQDYDRAEKLAAGLQRVSDTPEAIKLYEEASAAKNIADLALVKKDYAAAARELDTEQGQMLNPKLRKNLASKVALAWVDGARAAHNKKDDERAVEITREVMDKFPDQPETLALRRTIRASMLAKADKSLASAELQIKTAEGKDKAAASLREAETTVNKVLRLFSGGDPGKEDADAFYILGRVSELRNDQFGAYAAYNAALAEPEKADFAKLRILLARVEFITDPRRKEYIESVQAYRPVHFVRYADRAVALVNDNPADTITKARAYAVSARARVLLNEAEPPGSEGIKERRNEAISRYGLALNFPGAHPWRWRYELAQQLKAKMMGSSPEERVKLKADAVKQLEKAKDDAPAADGDQLITPLRKLIDAMK